MRFHVVALPHTALTDAYSACAYTGKIIRFARMMRRLGHEVFVYESDEPWAPDQYTNAPFEADHPMWRRQNAKAIAAIRARAQPQDFLCLIAGLCQQPIAAAFPTLQAVEYGVGYYGIFAKYCVFESYSHMMHCYGKANLNRGRFYDTVIPNYYDPADFPFSAEKDDYLLFMARLNEDKGLQIAVDVARLTGRKLIVCGLGHPPSEQHVEYRGVVGPRERGQLLSRAHALLSPTLYLEPFGGVAVEAQLCGTPVITTDFGAYPETVVEGVTGFRGHYLGEFVQAVHDVGRLDPVTIRERAIATYSLDVVAPQYDRYFRRLLTLWEKGWYTEHVA